MDTGRLERLVLVNAIGDQAHGRVAGVAKAPAGGERLGAKRNWLAAQQRYELVRRRDCGAPHLLLVTGNRPVTAAAACRLNSAPVHIDLRRFHMGAITQIAWCDATFNPWVGCLRVSTACDRCYAAGLSWRYGWRDGKGRDLWDVSADRKRTSSAYWRGPLRWSERAQAESTRRRVFCASMADVFDTKCRHRGASICGHWSARHKRSTGF
jgi:hypothetical protein